MPVKQVANKGEFDALANGSTLTVADAFATWCGPCKVAAPKFAELSEKYSDVNFVKFDVDEAEELAQALGVEAMPTFFLYKNGKEVAKVTGANMAAIEDAITKNK